MLRRTFQMNLLLPDGVGSMILGNVWTYGLGLSQYL